MAVYQLENVKAVLEKCIDTVIEKKGPLTDVDSLSGDGDLGVSMEKGALALRDTLQAYQDAMIGPMLVKAGAAFNKAAPSTMGTLTGMALVALGNAWKDKQTLTEQDVAGAPRILCDTIARFGKAKQGDKTILDALYPFADTLEKVYQDTGDLARARKEAVVAARAGMEATKGMTASVGRARWLGERAVEAYDGGALLCVFVLEGLEG